MPAATSARQACPNIGALPDMDNAAVQIDGVPGQPAQLAARMPVKTPSRRTPATGRERVDDPPDLVL